MGSLKQYFSYDRQSDSRDTMDMSQRQLVKMGCVRVQALYSNSIFSQTVLAFPQIVSSYSDVDNVMEGVVNRSLAPVEHLACHSTCSSSHPASKVELRRQLWASSLHLFDFSVISRPCQCVAVSRSTHQMIWFNMSCVQRQVLSLQAVIFFVRSVQ